MAIGQGVLEMDAWILKEGGKEEETILVFGVFLTDTWQCSHHANNSCVEC